MLGIVPGRTQALIGVWFELTRVIGLHKRDIGLKWRFFLLGAFAANAGETNTGAMNASVGNASAINTGVVNAGGAKL